MFSRFDIPIQPSGAITMLHLLPWLVLATLSGVTALHSLWFLPLTGAIGIAALVELRRTGQLCRLCVIDDRLEGHLRDGSQTRLQVLASTRTGSGWVWLRVRNPDGRRQTLLLSSRAGFRNTGTDNLRQLIGWLRLNTC